MPGPQTIYVDFTVRDPEGRFYLARIEQFNPAPQLGLTFIGTDYDEFEVECEVLAIFYYSGEVWVRPVDPATVPGTAAHPQAATANEPAAAGLRAEQATGELIPA